MRTVLFGCEQIFSLASPINPLFCGIRPFFRLAYLLDFKAHKTTKAFLFMDRVLKKKSWTSRHILLTGGSLILMLQVYQLLLADKRASLHIEREKAQLETVEKGSFLEFIPQTGTVQPNRTLYLDAVEGGIVREIKLESGAMVEDDDGILSLGNSKLQL